MQPAQPTTTPAALTAAGMTVTTEEAHQQQQQHVPHQEQLSTRETRASKKRKVWLSPGNDSTIASPGGIPQVDGADSVPSTPKGVLRPPCRRPPTPPYKDPPTPPPMSQYFPRDPYRVLCHLCIKNVHYLMYDQCEFCHYRIKFAYKNL